MKSGTSQWVLKRLPSAASAGDHVRVSHADDVLTELLDRARRDHLKWINGDSSGYVLPDEGTILGAIGGFSRGGAETARRQSAVAAQWLRGSGEIEFLNGAASHEMAWLTFIERSRVFLEGDVQERRWDLRVTEIFRRDHESWERVHRHADPMVDRRSVSSAADLLSVE